MPENKLSLCAFHEIGHAANANLSKIGKLLQKGHRLEALVLPIALTIFKPQKAPDEKPNGAFDKVTDFIKNNAGILTFLSLAPKLAEEAMASIKGNKFAQKILSPELVQKVAKTNKFGLITYLGTALASSVGIVLFREVYDAITKPKLITSAK